jgi:hypothetical protein
MERGSLSATKHVGSVRVPARGRSLLRTGGVVGNLRLTAVVGGALLLLLAAEGATIPWIRSLLTVHIFLGMLLLGPVALKLGATGYRFVRYYAGSPGYVEKGPPAPFMRVVVAPILVLSTLTLFGSGVGLIALGSRQGILGGLHKASFIVWFGAMSIHVLAYLRRATRHALAERRSRRTRSGRLGGTGLRLALLLVSVLAGLALALATLPQAHSWTHRAAAHHHRHDG